LCLSAGSAGHASSRWSFQG